MTSSVSLGQVADRDPFGVRLVPSPACRTCHANARCGAGLVPVGQDSDPDGSASHPHVVRIGILTHSNGSSSQDWNPDPSELLQRPRSISRAPGFHNRPVLSTTKAGGPRRTVPARLPNGENGGTLPSPNGENGLVPPSPNGANGAAIANRPSPSRGTNAGVLFRHRQQTEEVTGPPRSRDRHQTV
jgi:hypothetical protein